MTFAAFTSALIVRKGSSLDWQHFTLPSILYLNTVLLLCQQRHAGSRAAPRRQLSWAASRAQAKVPARWLYITLVFGLLFVAGQYVAWLQLRAEGLYLATNPSSSFFYVLTAAHALHVLGGLAGLLYVIGKLRKSELAAEHAGCDLALLAFHGRSLDVSAVAALDETLARSQTGGAVSQADLTMQGHSAGMLMDRPFAIPTKKLAMWLFIIADTMTFAACLVAYGFLRNGTPDWPRPFPQHHQRRGDDVHSSHQQPDHADRSPDAPSGGQSGSLPLDHDHRRWPESSSRSCTFASGWG